ncbi:MAG: PIG-L family deacetylase [Candidatus Aminicenantes bacterium]|nr:PIG-L family deacetylase [Candidatus Aminicenantes bacterium]
MKKIAAVVFLLAIFPCAKAASNPDGILRSGELQIALQKLDVLGSVLYLAAHPDDENTALLTYFSKGRKYRAAYLSLTRGSGGQNLIGPEKGAEIGIIRTQELLAARQIDGAEQFFTRAVDFGYSKTPEETFDFWEKEDVLADVVWVIRKFRPDVIVTRFPPDSISGHGHHIASAVLAEEAFSAAADPHKFPNQLKYVKTWQAKRLCWNSWRPGPEEIKKKPKIDTGEYETLLGRSYSEIAAESRSKHKSQGFGVAARRGPQYEYFEHIAGVPAETDLFDGIDTSWDRVTGSANVRRMLAGIITSFDPQHPSRSIPGLLKVYSEMGVLDELFWPEIKREEVLRIVQSCAGLWMEAVSDDFAAAPGDEVRVKTTIINRSDFPFQLDKIGIPEAASEFIADTLLKKNNPVTKECTFRIPKDCPISQPYWLADMPKKGLFSIREQNFIGCAVIPPPVSVKITLSTDGKSLGYSLPIFFRWTDRVAGELYRPLEIRPAVTIEIDRKVMVFSSEEPAEIEIKVKSHSPNISGNVRLKGTEKWRITPALIPFSLPAKYDETQVTFLVTPPKSANEAVLIAEAKVEGEKIDRSLVEISYPHIKMQSYFPQSLVKVVREDIERVGYRIGYIMGAGDEVENSLINLGYDVQDLSDEMLEQMELSQFDAIITGIRAYNTRERLKYLQEKLLKYVEGGGTLIVQYNVARDLQTENIGPYPFTIGRDRVSEESAPVSFPNPAHPLLIFPNKITQKDFDGWAQERGLYFASQWDERYEPVISSHDTNESEKRGGLLYARFGKGVFIYTSYSWFRQLPAGVPGALRLFANLIAAGKYDDRSAH